MGIPNLIAETQHCLNMWNPKWEAICGSSNESEQYTMNYHSYIEPNYKKMQSLVKILNLPTKRAQKSWLSNLWNIKMLSFKAFGNSNFIRILMPWFINLANIILSITLQKLPSFHLKKQKIENKRPRGFKIVYCAWTKKHAQQKNEILKICFLKVYFSFRYMHLTVWFMLF